MSRVDRVSEVAFQIEETIVSGELMPGDLLPSERAISARLGVSRSVVREALGRLASLGLVRSVHGSGTRVQAPSGRQITVGYERLLRQTDYRWEHLVSVRLPLEVTIASLAAEKRSDTHLDLLAQSQELLGDPDRSLEEHVKADLDFHTTLADATGNPLFRLVLAPMQELQIQSRRRTLGRYGAELAFAHHAKILDAVRAGDAEAAACAMREHLEVNYQHLHEVGGEFDPPAALEESDSPR
jgi:GntR family transcriptional repressor for pyruvate dehydrogenase complex